MKLEYAITYLACQSCTAKIHCEKCAAELTERLQKQRGVSDVQIDIPARRMSLQADGLDEWICWTCWRTRVFLSTEAASFQKLFSDRSR